MEILSLLEWADGNIVSFNYSYTERAGGLADKNYRRDLPMS